ncbi:cuticle protein 14 isoform b [Nephila pilipes]|uniref:Cuticle protein 14 isoform b n=1 Tax=Nephila pilipes TaxID=299642 RepID=A0A8X6QWZ7_NEPPI|nr:cuticle protein 14 isoform b [Nephila pilipes]
MTMQVLVFFALFAASHATAIFRAPAIIPSGDSRQYNSRDNFGNYNFGYNEDHYSGGSFRKETGDAYGNKFGSYGLQEADGRTRIVNYVADSEGFRADIKTNEPGIETKDSAAATFNKAIFPATFSAPAIPVSYAVDTSTTKTYASAPTTLSYTAYAPTTYKTYAPTPSTFAYSYASAPVKTYATATAPISYSTYYRPYRAESAPVFTYGTAPAPYNTYAPVRFFTGPAFYKQTSF